MAVNYFDEKSAPLQEDTTKSFGSFKLMLADILTFATVIRLATLFEYPPRIIEELEKKESRNHLMIRHMEERGQIRPADITKLLNGLKTLDLLGIESTVRKLFEDKTGVRCTEGNQQRGKTGYFVDSLRNMYALWYSTIQPIPYIRERVYCVNDVYVDSGIKVVETPNSLGQPSEDGHAEELTSFYDVFDANKISSKRILLEGDPGYGKSTLTLQAAYEWCLGSTSSPLKLFQIFILLPLRLLGNTSSIYTAIRLLLMPANVELRDKDVKEILNNCSFGVIVLDGYDEYPDKDSESDVIKIIKGNMFPNFRVVLTSRSSSLPRDLDPSTVTIRLNGFDDIAMYEYIKRAVTGGNDEEAKKIKDIINSSPILADFCQNPMFCVLFAHVTKDESHNVARFTSVTSFFKYIISCLYSHMRRKDSGTRQYDTIRDYKSLNKLAFESLVSQPQQIIWPKKTFVKTVGSKCYKEVLSIGILIEETILTINDEPGDDISNLLKSRELVRFCHKLFIEWYAGNYLSSYASGIWPIGLENTLDKINPVDLQYVFRFASGLNKRARERIVKYLGKLDGGKAFASLCLFEQTMDQGILEETVKDLLKEEVVIRSVDSKLLQRSNIQLLEVASSNGVPISRVFLGSCSPRVSESGLILESCFSLSVLSSLQQLEINDPGRELTQDDFVAILGYTSQCTSLKELMFWGYHLPETVPIERIPHSLKSRNVKVFEAGNGKRLNLLTGQLQKCDEYGKVLEDERSTTEELPDLSEEMSRMTLSTSIVGDDCDVTDLLNQYSD